MNRYEPFYPVPTVFIARFDFEPVPLANVPTGELLAALQSDRLTVRNVISVCAALDARKSHKPQTRAKKGARL